MKLTLSIQISCKISSFKLTIKKLTLLKKLALVIIQTQSLVSVCQLKTYDQQFAPGPQPADICGWGETIVTCFTQQLNTFLEMSGSAYPIAPLLWLRPWFALKIM